MDLFHFELTSLAVLCLATVLLYIFWTRYHSYGSIPGPRWSLPILGHLHWLGVKPHLALAKMQQRYGDVFRIQLGPHTAVVLSGKDVIKDSCALSSLTGRPHKFFNSWTKHDRYFAFGYSQACLRYRKVVMKAVGSFTKDRLHEAVGDVVDELVAILCQEHNGKAQSNQIRASVADISYFMCFGEKKRSRNDAEFSQVMESLNDILSFATFAGIADLFPWALYLPSINRKYQWYLDAQNKLIELVRHQEAGHKLSAQLTNGVQCPNQSGDLCDLLSQSLSEDELKGLREADPNIGTPSEQTGMLLVAGYETVAVSLLWAITLLATHQDVQEDIWKGLTTSNQCDLLDAFILESLRFSMASPMAMPHMTTEATTINGHHIPKETLVLVNLWSGSRDSRIWGADADKFNPYRFIDDSTRQVSRTLADQLVAFGSGRRRCVGERLAKTEIQLLLAGVIRRCRISLANEQEEVLYWTNTTNGRNVPPITDLKFIRR